MRLKDRVAIVTGGALGIGRVYARRFLQEGARVVLADIADPGDAVKALALHGEIVGRRTDVASAEATRAMAEAAVSRYGRIDVLVNNAPSSPRSSPSRSRPLPRRSGIASWP
jgi:NAD(P)-dependent dehydrogenase (short-subunit alcohol dehydrogenase family)